MDFNASDFKANVTLRNVANFFNISIFNVTNESEVTQARLFDLYEAYRFKEKEQLMVYKSVAYIVGTLIILSNLVVVISSGLILKKGQQPKSTYLLLGNVSLADTIIGISIIFGAIVDNSLSSNPLCIFQIGLIVCPVMVSIFSVGLIAVDRYIYILHGLYYQRWFNTTKVRIGIACTWMIGLTLGFMPVTGWVNKELMHTRCYYVALFPGALILFNSTLSMVPIVLVAVLYTIILIRALRNVRDINAAEKTINTNSKDKEQPKLRIYRGNNKKENRTSSAKRLSKCHNILKIKRSASLNITITNSFQCENANITVKSKSINDLIKQEADTLQCENEYAISDEQIHKHHCDSELSIYTVESRCSDPNISTSDIIESQNKLPSNKSSNKKPATNHKYREPNKWRAIIVVMLTSGSFIVSWTPFFVTVTFFVLCEEKLTNSKCQYLRTLLGGPLPTLAFLNSILNPLIYAWWHKGFQRSVKNYFHKYVRIFVASLPAMGWTGQTFRNYRCWYIAVFPSTLLLIMSIIVLSIIIMVCILYLIILHSAFKTVNKINGFKDFIKISYIHKTLEHNLKKVDEIYKSTETITTHADTSAYTQRILKTHKPNYNNVETKQFGLFKNKLLKLTRYCQKRKTLNSQPSKFKAIKTVLLVTLCFVCTWAPYYVTIIVYVKCDIMNHGYDCVPLEILTLRPLYLLGVTNSLFDPFIYAWRHSGFKKSFKKFYAVTFGKLMYGN